MAEPTSDSSAAGRSAIRYPVGYFGGASAELVMNFVADPERAASEVRRVTRRGGVVGACVWDFRGGLVYQRLFWDTAAGIDPDAGRMRARLFFGALALPDGLAALWRKTGLVAVEQFSLTMRMDYSDFSVTGIRCSAVKDPSGLT